MTSASAACVSWERSEGAERLQEQRPAVLKVGHWSPKGQRWKRVSRRPCPLAPFHLERRARRGVIRPKVMTTTTTTTAARTNTRPRHRGSVANRSGRISDCVVFVGVVGWEGRISYFLCTQFFKPFFLFSLTQKGKKNRTLGEFFSNSSFPIP